MLIRPAEVEDAAAIAATDNKPVDRVEWIKERIENPNIDLYVMTKGRELIGWGQIDHHPDHDELRWKIINPENRGKGYGTELAESLWSLTSSETNEVIAKISPDNIPSMRLAIGLGMVPKEVDGAGKIVFASRADNA